MKIVMKLKLYFIFFALIPILVLTSVTVSAPKKPTTVAEFALYQGANRQ